jgi:hypothetical protein
MARNRSHNCRFCGTALDFQVSATLANSFEIEHLFARGLGGTNHRSNLSAACNTCNKLKADRLSFVDFYYESFAIVSEDEQEVKPERFAHVILALLMKQGGKCFHCQRGFYLMASEAIVVVRRELDDYYHFRNCYVACRDCAEQIPLKGIEVGVPLIRREQL